MVDPLLLRFFERLAVVLFAGMAIYLGYLLFIGVREQKDAKGEVRLPWDISIVMSRIGPGAFFALFGVITLGIALIRPLEVHQQGDDSYYYVSVPSGNPISLADTRNGLRKEMAVLNQIPSSLKDDLTESNRAEIERTLRRVKLLLLQPVWGEADEGFGDFAEFEQWTKQGEPDPPPAGMEGALEVYRYGMK